MEILFHIGTGIVVGAYGTLVGAGGGFLLVPYFLMLRGMSPAVAVGSSLVVIMANAFSGSIQYMRQGRVNYRAGVLFALATFPGAYFGVHLAKQFSEGGFRRVFGLLMIFITFVLLRRKEKADNYQLRTGFGWKTTQITEHGKTHHYSYQEFWGTISSIGVGVLSSLMGIGGGILHVPLMSELLGFPVHTAVATSHFILTWTALVGASLHIREGSWDPHVALWIAVGAIAGAQLGGIFSRKLKGSSILRYLSLALLAVGLRLLF